MNIRLLSSCLMAVALASPLAAQTAKPNVIVILADDLGFADLGVHGGKDIPTPNIDSIAKNGVRCTQAYVSCPYCSPTRAGLNTGRYQTRFGHEFNEPGPEGRASFGLPLDQKTMGNYFKEQGYKTGAIGKWHLGYSPDRRPTARGYDEFYGTLGNTPFILATNFMDSRKPGDPQTLTDPDFYTTDAYAQRAVEFINEHKAEPFLLYLPFNACHVPVQTPERYLDRFPNIENPERKAYAGMLSALDDAVGRVLAAVREAKLEESTLIFFTADNGGPMTKMGQNGSNNGQLRGQKGDVWEGGIRVPLLVQWKGQFPAGTLYEQPVISLDILPTALTATTLIPTNWKLDGVSLRLRLERPATRPPLPRPHDHLCWRFGPQWAIRQGDWKLAQGFDESANPMPGQPDRYKVTEPQLFNLATDPGETKNLAAAQPEKVAALKDLYDKWNAENKDPAWVPNPNPAAGKKKKAN